MQNQMHTVLGATGATGMAVIEELKARNLNFNAVHRGKGLKGINTINADLLKPDEAEKAIQHSNFVYLCVGLPYQSVVWEKDWPLLMQNVISACHKRNAKLIFFDNAYMYGPGPLSVPFDENHIQNPNTRKGLARKHTQDLLLKAISDKKVTALIGRSADFYGDGATNSILYVSFLQNMLKGKAPQILGKKGIAHTYAHTGDNAKALVALALDQTTYGQVWHLPVGKPITFDELNDIMNQALGTDFKLGYVSNLLRMLLSLFISPIREVEEMLYQFDTRYEMNSEKFMKHFPDFKVTPYETGIRSMILSFKNKAT